MLFGRLAVLQQSLENGKPRLIINSNICPRKIDCMIYLCYLNHNWIVFATLQTDRGKQKNQNKELYKWKTKKTHNAKICRKSDPKHVTQMLFHVLLFLLFFFLIPFAPCFQFDTARLLYGVNIEIDRKKQSIKNIISKSGLSLISFLSWSNKEQIQRRQDQHRTNK